MIAKQQRAENTKLNVLSKAGKKLFLFDFTLKKLH